MIRRDYTPLELDFLLELERGKLEKLLACIRDRVDKVSEI